MTQPLHMFDTDTASDIIKGRTPAMEARIAEAAADRIDLAEIKGQDSTKRALEVVAAGGHNLLYVGPSGTWQGFYFQSLKGTSVDDAIPVVPRSLTTAQKLPFLALPPTAR